jgi:hypoxanthine phosphoribosyltransferase
MSRKVFYKESTVKGWVHEIIRSMAADGWRPDYIVGLTRGGLVPANMLSQYLDVPMHTLKVSFRDDDHGPESNLWMSEDALAGTKILIVDDINDTGATLNWIQDDWMNSALPDNERWNHIWGDSVRTAVLINNEASEFKDPDYVGMNINKLEEPIWCVFPWEEWWT